MKNLRQQSFFSLVEILIAIGVIAIGVVGIMCLFPVGLKSSKASIGKSNASMAADQFLHYFTDKIKKDWQVSDAIPINKPGDDESNLIWNNPVETGVEIYYNDENNNSTFDYDGSVARDDSGIFLVEQSTYSNKDFSGIVRVWKTASTYRSYDAQAGGWLDSRSIEADAGITVNLELSWPSQKPYDQRTKSRYRLDAYKPGLFQKDGVTGSGGGIFEITKGGTMSYTFLGSSAALLSGFYMSAPDSMEIFSHNDENTQIEDVVTEYSAGDAFNFFIRVYGSGVTHACDTEGLITVAKKNELNAYYNGNWKLGTYDHYAWGSTIDLGAVNFGSNHAPLNHYTGALTKDKRESDGSLRRFCICEEVIPQTKWILRFEDLPHKYYKNNSYRGSDWDYYDVVVEVELDESGDGTTSANNPIDGILTLMDSDDMQFTLVPQVGAPITKDDLADSGETFNDKAVAIWFKVATVADQTIDVDGNITTIDKESIYYISARNMDVTVTKSGDDWELDVYTGNGSVSTTVN
ncbi:MAG: hypothetical protein U9O87_08690 [Verrucomicrobiota bacterium]|nr:hypothetical protein [Verrucomicrobiota bacterium]